MKEEIEALLAAPLEENGLFISDVYLSKEEGLTQLNIELDSDTIIDLEKITEATKLINPILDKTELTKKIDVLDIHSKSKGDDTHE